MQISNYELNMNREDIAAYCELRSKHEERSSIIIMLLIAFGVPIIGSFVLTRVFLEYLTPYTKELWIVDVVIIQFIIIVILSLLMTCNCYRCGKLFKMLRKNKDMVNILRYAREMHSDEAVVQVAYILYFNLFIRAYISSSDSLVIEYREDGQVKYYSTHLYTKLYKTGDKYAILRVTPDGIRLINKDSQSEYLPETGGYVYD